MKQDWSPQGGECFTIHPSAAGHLRSKTGVVKDDPLTLHTQAMQTDTNISIGIGINIFIYGNIDVHIIVSNGLMLNNRIAADITIIINSIIEYECSLLYWHLLRH